MGWCGAGWDGARWLWLGRAGGRHAKTGGWKPTENVKNRKKQNGKLPTLIYILLETHKGDWRKRLGVGDAVESCRSKF